MDNFPSEDAAPGAMEQGEQPEGDMGVAFNSMPMSEEQQAMQEGPQGQLGQEGESSMFTGGEQGKQQQEYGPSQDSNNEGNGSNNNDNNDDDDDDDNNNNKPVSQSSAEQRRGFGVSHWPSYFLHQICLVYRSRDLNVDRYRLISIGRKSSF